MRSRLLLLTGALVAVAMSVGAGPAAAATCFGAAARDAARPCENPSRTIFPALKDVDHPSESRCAYRIERSLPICTFGAPKAKARGTIALIGDSHSWHLRAAVDVVARARKWAAYSITAPGCAFSTYVTHLPEEIQASCRLWYQRAKAWLRRHREVSTVFMSTLNSVYAPPGETRLRQRAAGLRRAWLTMPRTVKHVIVVKDVPDPRDDVLDCVSNALAAGTELPGIACATPRNAALTEDAGVEALKRLPPKRFGLVDLTDYFCDAENCFPVVGGALVYRDELGHLTVAFSKSLGPYLLRKVNTLMVAQR